jgi:hypothetical protein
LKREAVDFFLVPDKQIAIHIRLENWARSCWGGFGTSVSPMFRQYRSAEHWQGPTAPSMPIDRIDASTIAKEVRKLPEPHMRALNWYYIGNPNEKRTRQDIGCTRTALAQYVLDGRTMLINRRV